MLQIFKLLVEFTKWISLVFFVQKYNSDLVALIVMIISFSVSFVCLVGWSCLFRADKKLLKVSKLSTYLVGRTTFCWSDMDHPRRTYRWNEWVEGRLPNHFWTLSVIVEQLKQAIFEAEFKNYKKEMYRHYNWKKSEQELERRESIRKINQCIIENLTSE